AHMGNSIRGFYLLLYLLSLLENLCLYVILEYIKNLNRFIQNHPNTLSKFKHFWMGRDEGKGYTNEIILFFKNNYFILNFFLKHPLNFSSFGQSSIFFVSSQYLNRFLQKKEISPKEELIASIIFIRLGNTSWFKHFWTNGYSYNFYRGSLKIKKDALFKWLIMFSFSALHLRDFVFVYKIFSMFWSMSFISYKNSRDMRWNGVSDFYLLLHLVNLYFSLNLFLQKL
ncbi:hypothetical protein ACJX0J_012162, partial [Zea mays]